MFRFRNTKAFKVTCLILACSIFLTSCHTLECVPLQDEYNAKLNGKSQVEIIELIGPPDRTVSDGQGGEIMVYEIKSQQGNVSKGSINLKENRLQTSVYIDGNKICYKVKSDDQKCEKVFSTRKTIAVLVLCMFIGIPLIGMASD